MFCHTWATMEDGHKVCEDCYCSTRPQPKEGLPYISPYFSCEENKIIARVRRQLIAEGIRHLSEACDVLFKVKNS